MGKMILIIVLGVSSLIGFFIMKLNANSKQGLEVTVEHYSAMQARLIANSGVETYLEKMRRDKTLYGNFLNNDLFNGEYDIYISGTDPDLTIRSVARYEDKTHEAIVKATRYPVPFPSVAGALYVSSSNLSINFNGNLEINGNDTNPDGSPGTEDPLPGVAVDSPNDSAYIVDVLKPKISKDITGYGGSPSVWTEPDSTDWMAITQEIIFAADITIPTGTYSSGIVLGTTADPKITYVTGDVHFSGSCVGDGIMVINGNLTMSGDFKYRGIMIVYGKSTINTQIVGNGGVYGSVILVGSNVSIQATGNSAFYYSSSAIENAKTNLNSSRFKILSWWE